MKKMQKNKGTHRKCAWRLAARLLICFILFIVIAPLFATPAQAACRGNCDPSKWTYSYKNGTYHTVTCNTCREHWYEAHVCAGCSSSTCLICGGSSSNGGHSWQYQAVNSDYCSRTCRSCGKSSGNISHDLRYQTTTDTYKVYSCRNCGYTSNVALDAAPPAGDDSVSDFAGNAFTWQIYRVLCVVCIPIAIVSLAHCGFQFLGAILFGSYVAPGGGDMQKAQKQFTLTILAIILLLLMPYIFGAAISYFRQNAWRP